MFSLSLLTLPLLSILKSVSAVPHLANRWNNEQVRWLNCSQNVPEYVASIFNFTGRDWPTSTLGPLPTNLSCGRLVVPMHYDQQISEKNNITIGFSMLNATARPSNGILFVNEGGPDEAQSAVWLASLGKLGMVNGLFDFDIVAYDPRGYGDSNPMVCDDSIVTNVTLGLVPDEASFEAFRTTMQKYAKSCLAKSTPAGIAYHLDSTSVAGDYESLRIALGAPSMTFIGLSYGTVWGQSYIRKYPDNLNRVLLDGVAVQNTGASFTLEIATRSLNDYIVRSDDWCLHNSTCVFHGDGKGSVTAALKAAMDSVSNDTTRQHQLAVIMNDLALDWPSFSRVTNAVKSISDGAKTGNWSGADAITASFPTDIASFLGSRLWTMCADVGAGQHGFDEVQKLREEMKPHDTYSLIGGSQWWSVTLACAVWPQDPIVTPTAVADEHVLITTSDFDINSPTEWADKLFSVSLAAKYLVRHGDDHCTLILQPPFFSGPNPTRDVEVAWLNNGTLPNVGTSQDKIYTFLEGSERTRPELAPYDEPIGIKALDVDPAEE